MTSRNIDEKELSNTINYLLKVSQPQPFDYRQTKNTGEQLKLAIKAIPHSRSLNSQIAVINHFANIMDILLSIKKSEYHDLKTRIEKLGIPEEIFTIWRIVYLKFQDIQALKHLKKNETAPIHYRGQLLTPPLIDQELAKLIRIMNYIINNYFSNIQSLLGITTTQYTREIIRMHPSKAFETRDIHETESSISEQE